MDLLEYLSEQFYSETQLLALTQTSQAKLLDWQAQAIMPQPSYQLALQVQSLSFFGQHNETSALRYYAKGYTSWIGFLSAINSDFTIAKARFCQRYRHTFEQHFNAGLKPSRFCTAERKLDIELLLQHIDDEWTHFIAGTYGLCTKTGLPEQIAGKEIAILLIEQITDQQQRISLAPDELTILQRAVNLLDVCSSMFAPHERARSSRTRCIDKVRQQYQLSTNAFG